MVDELLVKDVVCVQLRLLACEVNGLYDSYELVWIVLPMENVHQTLCQFFTYLERAKHLMVDLRI